jgi:virulence-associated protein VapD
MAAQKRYKMINFDLDTRKLEQVFGENKYRKGYSLIQRFFVRNGFLHHQYSGYISQSAMSYGEIYILITDKMLSELPWIVGCVNKFDATNVTSQSDMLVAIKSKANTQKTDISSGLEGDDEIVI